MNFIRKVIKSKSDRNNNPTNQGNVEHKRTETVSINFNYIPDLTEIIKPQIRKLDDLDLLGFKGFNYMMIGPQRDGLLSISTRFVFGLVRIQTSQYQN